MREPQKYYGKYRGTVMENVDPLHMGRILAMVPDVSGLLPTSWAMPCVPLAGKQAGTHFVPQRGAGVWVEFEQGDPNHPIWVGCYWGSLAEVPAQAQLGVPTSPSIVLQTELQNGIIISDMPGPAGGIMLKSATGLSSILVNDAGIFITSGKASIVLSSGVVAINDLAMVIT
jgi:uncharacterized protein involved in type VI secretion and phage assembly